MKLVSEIEQAVYPYEKARELYDASYWGDSPEANIICGLDAKAEATKKGYVIPGGDLHDDVGYIFRWNLKGDKLIPYHMTMLPKTAANISRGSEKFGSGSIMQEAMSF